MAKLHERSSGLSSRAGALLWLSLPALAGGCSTAPHGLRPDLVVSSDVDAAEANLWEELAAAPTDPELNLRMGALQFQRGRYAAAREHLQTTLDSQANNGDALQLLGLVALGEGLPAEAAQHFLAAAGISADFARAVEPDLLRALRQAIDAAILAGRPADVFELAALLEERGGASDEGYATKLAQVFAARAQDYYAGGYYREALGLFDRAESLDKEPERLFLRACAAAQLGMTDAAATGFEQFAAALPEAERGRAWRRVGEFYEGAFQFEPAVAAYDRAHALDPTQDGLANQRGGLFLKSRNFDAAVKAFDEAVDAAPAHTREALLVDISKLLLKFQAKDLAQRYLERAIRENPGSLVPVNALARLLGGNDSPAVRALFEQHLSRDAGAEALARVGKAALELGLLDYALEVEQRRLALPGQDDACLEMARIHQRKGSDTERDAALEAYLRRAGDSAQAWERAGAVASDLGAETKALEYLERAHQAEPGRILAATELASILAARGQSERARGVMEAHLQASSDPCASRLSASASLGPALSEADYEALVLPATACPKPAEASEAWWMLGVHRSSRRNPDLNGADEALRGYLAAAPEREPALERVAGLLAGRPGLDGLRTDVLAGLAELRATDAESWLAIADAYLEVGWLDKVVPPLQRYITSSADKPRALAAALDLLFRKQAEQEALELLEGVDESILSDPNVHLRLGLLASQPGPRHDLERARRHFERFVSSSTAPGSEMRAAGDQMAERGLHDLAAKAYRKAMATPGERIPAAERLGVSYIALLEPEKAAAAFEVYLEGSGNTAQALESVARHWSTGGYARRAFANYLRALSLAQRNQREAVFNATLEVVDSLGDNEALLSLVAEYLALWKDQPRELHRCAEELLRRGRFTEAAELWDRLLAMRAGDTEALLGRFTAMVRSGQAEAASEIAKQLAGLRNWRADTVIALADAFVAADMLEQARALLDGCIEQQRANAELFVRRARLALRLGDADGLHAHAMSAAAAAVQPEATLRELGPLYVRAGRLELWVDLLERALAQSPDEPMVSRALVEAYLSAGRADEADSLIRRLSQRDEQAAQSLAPVLAQYDRREEALRLYSATVERSAAGDDARAEAFAQAVELLVVAGRGEELGALLTRFLANAGDPAVALRHVVSTLLGLGRLEEAVGHLQALVQTDPDPQLQFHLGELYALLGREQEAVRAYRAFALEARPNRSDPAALEATSKRALQASRAMWTRGMRNEAVALVEAAYVQRSDDEELLAELTRLDLARDKGHRALERAARAIRDGRVNTLAALLEQVNRLSDAGLGAELEAALTQAAADVPSPVQELVLLRLAGRRGDREAVKRLADSYERRLPAGDWAGRLELARALAEVGDTERAASILRPAVRAPELPGWRLFLDATVRLELLRDDPEAAEAALREALAGGEARVAVLQAVTEAAVLAQLWDVATLACQTLAQLNPGSLEPYRELMGVRISAGDIDGAYAAALQAAARAEDRDAMLSALAQAAERRLSSGLALRITQEQLRHAVGDAALHLQAMRLAVDAERLDDATTHAREYQRLHGAKARAAIEVASVWLGGLYADQALAALDAAGDAEPWRAALIRARAALQRGEHDTAVQHLDAIAESYPGEVEWQLLRLAELAFESWDMPLSVAAHLARRALEKRPGLPTAHLILALHKVESGDASGADAFMSAYEAPGAALLTGRQRMAQAALRSRFTELAERELDRLFTYYEEWSNIARRAVAVVRDQAPSDGERPSADRARALRELGFRYLAPLRRLDPLDTWFITLESDLLESTGERDRASRVYERLLPLLPLDSTLHNNLAYLWARRGERLEEALTLVRRARQLEPNNGVYYLDTEGWVRFQQGRYDEAAELIEQSVRLLSTDQGSSVSESFWHLGQVMERLDRPDDARRQYRRALLVDPNGQYGTLALGALRRLGGLPSAKPTAEGVAP
jgi:Tfp pilus assembly protein PilF